MFLNCSDGQLNYLIFIGIVLWYYCILEAFLITFHRRNYLNHFSYLNLMLMTNDVLTVSRDNFCIYILLPTFTHLKKQFFFVLFEIGCALFFNIENIIL